MRSSKKKHLLNKTEGVGSKGAKENKHDESHLKARYDCNA